MNKKAKRFTRTVTNQDTSEVYTSENHNPYWDYVERQGRSEDGGYRESKFANPDILEDHTDNKLWGAGESPELAQLIIERFMDAQGNFPILTPKENEVLKVYTITGDMNLVCKQTKLNRSSVNTLFKRISVKMQQLIKATDL